MVRCEVTGKLFPANECEVVIIKIIKSKAADINQYNLFPFKERVVEIGKPTIEVKKEEVGGLVPGTEDYRKKMHVAQSIIPPAMRDIFSKPPGLE